MIDLNCVIEMTSVTICRIMLLQLLLPWIANANFLKSMGDLHIIEGEEIVLDWIEYSEGDRIPPCSWWYLPNEKINKTAFLTYVNGKSYYLSTNMTDWKFTSPEQPCSGGIRKIANVGDTGIYMMETKFGFPLRVEDAYTHVKVYTANKLTFSVTVNGVNYDCDLSDGPEISLNTLETDKPVNITLKLSDAFPATAVIRKSDLREFCVRPHNGCNIVTDLKAHIDNPVVISVETGITGVNPVIVSLPVIYTDQVKERNKTLVIAFGFLFSFLLCIITTFVTMLLCKVNKNRRMFERSGSNQKETCLSAVINNMRYIINSSGFSDTLSEGRKMVSEYSREIERVKYSCEEKRQAISSEKKHFHDFADALKIEIDTLRLMCYKIIDILECIKEKQVPDRIQPQQKIILTLYRDLITDAKQCITDVENDLDRVTENVVNLKTCEIEETEEDISVEVEMDKNRESKETDPLCKKLFEAIRQQCEKLEDINHQEVILNYLLKELESCRKCEPVLKNRLTYQSDKINKINTDVRTLNNKLEDSAKAAPK